MIKMLCLASALSVGAFFTIAQQTPSSGSNGAPVNEASKGDPMQGMHHRNTHEHEYPAAVSLKQLRDTVNELDRVRQVTAKYHDVNVAKADGYVGTGNEIKGMGIHYLREVESKHFDAEKPSMLVYEKDSTKPGGVNLVGVCYLLSSAEGPDGQPVDNPFPKPLAIWHKHERVCVLNNPKNKLDHTIKLTEEECNARGGHFNDQWMIHAWIWKDSPLGVFSPSNPVVAVNGFVVPELGSTPPATVGR
jgi:hypothetical protein